MRTKLIGIRVTLLALTVCATAPSIAAAANAPDLTFPTGTLLGVGSNLKGTNQGNSLRFTSSSGMSFWECTKTELTGTLTKNKGSEIEADIESFGISGTGSEGRCTGTILPRTDWVFNPAANGVPWCLRSTSGMKEDEVQIRGGSCSGEARAIRIVQITTFETPEGGIDAVECVYQRTAAVPGTYTTDPQDAVMTFSEVEWILTTGGLACSATWKLDFNFTLERDEATASPLYIS